MLNLKTINQVGGVNGMYIKPEFEIVELTDEDIISTSLTDDGEKNLGSLGTFEWF